MLVGLVGCVIGLCAFVRPRVPCVPCVSRLPPVSFYWLGPPLIRPPTTFFLRPHARATLRPCCGRLQARRRTALLPTISPFAIDLRAPFATRLDARALRRSCARTPKLGPARARSTMALSARACCARAAAKAPTQRVARRNQRRMWCLGLRLDAQGGGGGGGGGGDGSHLLCSTPS